MLTYRHADLGYGNESIDAEDLRIPYRAKVQILLIGV
jgi:hypothetical protein